MTKALPIALAASLMLSACAGMSDTERRTVTGAGVGAAGGAVIGAIAGNAGLGALIGAGAGAAGGYIYDQHKKSQQTSYNEGYAAGQASK
jgi:hypothetical protein